MARHRLMIWICCVAVLLRLPVFLFPYVNIDENEYAIAARILLHGGLPYRDFLIYQPPVIYYIYALAFTVFHTSSLWAIHAFVIGIVVCTCLLLAAIGRRIFGASAGVWAAGCYAVFSTTFLPFSMLGANCEVILVVMLCGALWCLLQAETKTTFPFVWMVCSGALAGLAFLTKYQAGIYLLPIGIYLLRRGSRWRARLHLCIAFAGGWGLVVGSVAFWFVSVGVWPEVWAALQYILQYAKGPPQNDWVYIGLKFVARTGLIAGTAGLLWWNAARAIRQLIRQRDNHYGRLLIGLLVVGFVVVIIGGRIYFHYYYLVMVPLTLLAGAYLSGAFGKGWSTWPRATRAGWGMWTLFWVLAALGFSFTRYLEWGNLTSIEWKPAATYLQRMAQPNETLFVWGYCPQLYTVSRLASATRFTTADYLTGRTPKTAGLEYDPVGDPVPSSWEKFLNDFRNPAGIVEEDTSANVFPGAWEYLRQDFSKRLPDIIVDTAPSNYRRYGRYPVEKFPFLYSILAKDYTKVAEMNGYAIYHLHHP